MISQAESDAGLLAYEQVQAFAALRRKQVVVAYICLPALLALAGAAGMLAGWPAVGALVVAAAIGCAMFAAWNWRRLRELDAKNRNLLAQLEAKYGEELPWLQVERQLAEIRRIEAEQGAPPPDAG
jgi:hypothetical protein